MRLFSKPAPQFQKNAQLARMPREQRDILFILLTLLLVLFPHFIYLPIWVSSLSILTLLWRAILARQNIKLPGKTVKTVLVITAFILIALNYRSIAGPMAGDTLLVCLVSLKTLELRAKRDALVIFYLGFFLILMGFSYSQNIPMAICMLVSLTALLTALTNANMPAGYPPLKEPLTIALRLMFWGLPLMVVLYLIFPRLDPLWAMPTREVSKTGVSNMLSINSISELVNDESIAFRVRFIKEAPPQSSMYFRGPVLSLFNGRQWRSRDLLLNLEGNNASDPISNNYSAIEYEITMEATNQPWLFTLDFTPPQQPPVLNNSANRPHINIGYQWMLEREIRDRIKYHTTAYMDYHMGQNISESEKNSQTDIPRGNNPYTQQWAQQLLQTDSFAKLSNEDKANWVLNYIRQNKFHYTLKPPTGYQAQSAADQLWFDYQSGYCEHYAYGFAILMRSLGIPARIVTGYLGAEPNLIDNYWIVRQSNAHAWNEIWQPGKGWIRMDPTAAIDPARIDDKIASMNSQIAPTTSYASLNWNTKLKMRWQAMENAWNQWVLGYSVDKGLGFMDWLGIKKATWFTLAGILAGLLIMLTGGYLLILKWRAPKPAPWTKAYTRLREKLEKAGFPSDISTGPRRLAHIISQSASKNQSLKNARKILLALEKARYTSLSGQKQSLRKISNAIKKLRISINK